MTVRAIKVKGEQLSILAHADSTEKLISGTVTGETPTTWNFKVKGTYLHWVDDDGAERRKEGTLTGGSRAFANVTVHGEQIYYGDEDGNERYASSVTGVLSAVLDTLEWDATTGQEPRMIHVSGDIFAIVYTANSGQGGLVTVDIDSTGAIVDTVVDSWMFTATYTVTSPHIINVGTGVFAIYHAGGASTKDITISTVAIANDGTITKSLIDSLAVETRTTFDTAGKGVFQNVSGTTYIGIYAAGSDQGKLFSVDIDTSGNIGAAIIDSLTVSNLDTSYGLCFVSGDVWIAAGSGAGFDGYMHTFTVDSAGNIGAAVIDTWEFNTSYGFPTRVLKISGTTYALVSASDTGGSLITFSVANDGTITKSVIDRLDYETDRGGYEPDLVLVDGDVYLIANLGTDFDGFVWSCTIDADGDISAVVATLEYDIAYGNTPHLLLVPSTTIVAIAYEGESNDGFLKTVEVT